MAKTYSEVIERIEATRDMPARQESLARFRQAYEVMAPEISPSQVILVAGTNGKGTVSKTLETLLQQPSKQQSEQHRDQHEQTNASIGLFTSPHMMNTTERIRSGGRDLSREEFTEIYFHVESLVERFGLSHFETLTLMMIEAFFGGRVRPRVKRAVIEVGVGGRLDPTRLLPHAVSVITRLGLDHMDLLGSTLEKIAGEKLAIVDEDNLVVHAPLISAAAPALLAAKSQVRAQWFEAPIYPFRVDEAGLAPRWEIITPWGQIECPLLGERAVQNISLALCALDKMGENVGELLPRLVNVQWPCRMERREFRGRAVYLSGDHNPQGVDSLEEIIRHFRYRELHLVVGVAKNKDRSAMLEAFCRLPRMKLYLTSTPFRGAPVESYGPEWLQRAVFAASDPWSTLETALAQAASDDLILVSGSLYLVGHLRAKLIG